MNLIYDKILSKFHEIADDEKITDGWQAFSDMWDWIENEAAQSEQRTPDHKHDFTNSRYCHICGQAEF